MPSAACCLQMAFDLRQMAANLVPIGRAANPLMRDVPVVGLVVKDEGLVGRGESFRIVRRVVDQDVDAQVVAGLQFVFRKYEVIVAYAVSGQPVCRNGSERLRARGSERHAVARRKPVQRLDRRRVRDGFVRDAMAVPAKCVFSLFRRPAV